MAGKIPPMTACAPLYKQLTLLIAVLFLALPIAVCAEEITYTGNWSGLQNSPSWFSAKPDISLFPGLEEAPLASDNKVTLNYTPETSGVLHPEFVYGGMSESDSVANNTVVLLNGRVDRDMSAGSSISGDIIGNRVSMSGGVVGKDVLGGKSVKGGVTRNTATISGGFVKGSVYGGYSKKGGAADGNVTVSDGSVGMTVSGGYSENGDAAGNTVTISGGSVDWNVYGGSSVDGSVMGNTVHMSGGSVGWSAYGGWGSLGNVSGNIITFSGGSVRSVVGGYGSAGVTGNTVLISGGVVYLDVSGGRSLVFGEITNNTVTISGNPDLTNANIYGGFNEKGNADAFTGNTLNLKNSGISVNGVRNFEYYNFCLPKNLAAGGVMLSVNPPVNLKGTTVGIFLQGSTKLRGGDTITLIHSAKGIKNAPKNKSCQVIQDGTLYEFSIYTNKNNLWAEVTKISAAMK